MTISEVFQRPRFLDSPFHHAETGCQTIRSIPPLPELLYIHFRLTIHFLYITMYSELFYNE